MSYSISNHKIQLMLAYLGYYVGKVDGHMNRATRIAIGRFQQNSGLHDTARIDQTTINLLYTTFLRSNHITNAELLQQLLFFAGYNTDENLSILQPSPSHKMRFYSSIPDALQAFQRNISLYDTGTQDLPTLMSLKKALYAK